QRRGRGQRRPARGVPLCADGGERSVVGNRSREVPRQRSGAGNNSFAKALNWEKATPPCWSFVWRGTRRMVTYRADVMRFLPGKANGKIGVNGAHQIRVPDGGHFYVKDDDDEELGIADAGDRWVDSSVMIKNGSFSAVCPIIPNCPTCGT